MKRILASLASLLVAVTATGLLAAPAQAVPIVRITIIHYKQIGTNLDTEYVVIKNTTSTAKNITGWRMISSPGTDNQVYTFPTTAIPAYGTLTLYSGRGTNSAGRRYWNSATAIWNNDGDYAVLRSRLGTTISTCRYAGGGTTAYC